MHTNDAWICICTNIGDFWQILVLNYVQNCVRLGCIAMKHSPKIIQKEMFSSYLLYESHGG